MTRVQGRTLGEHGFRAGYLMVVVAAIGYGTLGPLAELARGQGVSSLGFAAGRSLIAAVLVLAFAIIFTRSRSRSDAEPLARRLAGDSRVALVAVGVLSAIVNFALVAAIARTSVATTLLVFYTYPAIVALAGLWWLRERLSRSQWIALVIAMVGSALVVSGPSAATDGLGLTYAVGAAVGGALFVIAARHGYGRVTPIESSVVILAVGALCLCTVFVTTGGLDELQSLAPMGVAITSLAAVTSAAIPTGLFIAGIQRIGASPAAGLATLEPVAGAVLALVLLHELLSAAQYVGGALVVVGALVLQTTAASDAVRPPELQGG